MSKKHRGTIVQQIGRRDITYRAKCSCGWKANSDSETSEAASRRFQQHVTRSTRERDVRQAGGQ